MPCPPSEREVIMDIFMFGASLRKDSYNKKLITLAAKIVEKYDHQTDLADFSEFDMPLYNADIQAQGFPKNVTAFIERMHRSDGLIISTPEYNFSMPGTLKNLIDWVSRVKPMPWKDQSILLLSASPSQVGGNRGLWNTRIPLECCGAVVHPEMFSLAQADSSFDNQGNLKNADLTKRLDDTIQNFIKMTTKLKK